MIAPWSSPDPLSAFVTALGWNSIYAAVLAILVALSCRAIGPTRPAFRLALLSLIYVRLVLPPDLAHRWSLGAVVAGLRGVLAEGAVGHGLADGGPVVTSLAGPIPAGVETAASSGLPWPYVVTALWLVGFCAVAVRWWRRRRVFRALRARALPVDCPEVAALVRDWRRRFRIRRGIRVVTGAGPAPPFTVGVIHPVIYLPEPVISNPRALEPAIAHELAHVARFDSLWLMLQSAIQAVYFFNPLIWLCGARLTDERERLCDQTVLTAGRMDARSYARGLLDVLRLDLQEVGAPTMSARKRRIGVRIRNILAQDIGRPPRVVIAVCASVVVGLLALPMAAVSSDPSNRPSEAAVTGPPTSAPEAVPEAAAAPAPEVVPEAAAAPAAPLPPAAEAAPIAPLAPAAEPVPAPQVSAIDGAVPPVPEAAPAPESPPSPPAPPIELTDPLPGGRVTWGWGPGRNPFSGREVFHRGIDIAAPSGTPITAPAAGTVVVATESYEPSPNSGTVLIIDNDGGYTTFFAHLASIEVLEGQRVGAGDVVATVGSTGMSTGPHLHFELRWQGQALDPARFVDAWR